MEHIIPRLAPVPQPEPSVVVLHCVDRLQFDPEPLKRLFDDKSYAEAEEVVCRVLEDIAARMNQIQSDLAGCAFDLMVKPASRIGLVADQIGLTEVSVAARHVVTCLRQRDAVALQATIARLERSFDLAVSEVWNFRDR